MNEFIGPSPLDPSHNLEAFDCGKEPLNDFLRLHALGKQNARLSRTYVIGDSLRIVGYYTLAHISVQQDELPSKLGRGMPRTVPAILMARFAVDLGAQRRGLGRSLFTDAIRRTWAVIESGAAPVRVFAVDAKDEDARSFYLRFDMIPSPHNPMRLYLSYKTIGQLFRDEE